MGINNICQKGQEVKKEDIKDTIRIIEEIITTENMGHIKKVEIVKEKVIIKEFIK